MCKIINIILISFLISLVFVMPAESAQTKKEAKEAKAKILRLKQQEQRKKVNESKGKLDAEKSKLDEFNARESELASKVKKTEESLWKTENEIRYTIFEQDKLSADIQETKNQIEQLKIDIADSRKKLSGRLKEVNKRQMSDYWAVLFKSDNFYDFVTRLDFIKKITQNDVKEIKKLKEQRLRLEHQEEELISLRNELIEAEKRYREQQMREMQLRAEQKSVLDQVSAQKAVQSKLVYDLEFLTRGENAELEELIRQEQALYADQTRKIKPAGKPQKVVSSSSFIWPVRGVITSPFGYRMHPIRGRYIFHSGIDIGVASGTPIKCSANGTVIMSTWYGGYGNCIIVDHGGGWSTLYGHCSALYVSKGKTVLQGTVIGAVGSTGMSTGPHLHFEVRYNGSPVDPRSRL